ncbi:hypothetical protein GCM10010313_64120 [Streptomyces violarus]|nr:hypothetical protein GCM10010313_64120 [Streptomyces violarus]
MDAAVHAAATVSAARRADDLLGNGVPSGDMTGAGTRVVRGLFAATCGVGGVTRVAAVDGGAGGGRPGEQLSADFYARQSPAWSRHLSRFRPCTAADGEMKWAAWVEIRLG